MEKDTLVISQSAQNFEYDLYRTEVKRDVIAILVVNILSDTSSLTFSLME